MTLPGIAALFGAMVVLAAIPSVSVLVVSARSATSGFKHGALTTTGVVVGDIIFIGLALGGLSILADTLRPLFGLVKYLGGAYLIWLGITLWRSTAAVDDVAGVSESSLLSSFLTGLFITLGDLKAILFYLGFFPAFLDLTAISVVDAAGVILAASIAVGGVKLGYAFLADRTRLLFNRTGIKKIANLTAGGLMIGLGLFLLVKV